MGKRINVNDFDKIAKKLMEMKAAAEAEGTEEAWNAYAFERETAGMVPAWELTSTRIPASSLWQKATSPTKTAGLFCVMQYLALAHSDLTLSIHREWIKWTLGLEFNSLLRVHFLCRLYIILS